VAAGNLWDWSGLLLGLATGVLGGAIQSKILAAPITHGVLLGGTFGLVFSFSFSRRATTPGAGLIWGLGAALLLLLRAWAWSTIADSTWLTENKIG
jgi:hypothetical protein